MSRRDRHIAGLSPSEYERAQRAAEIIAGYANTSPRRELTPAERKAKRERWRRNVRARQQNAAQGGFRRGNDPQQS